MKQVSNNYINNIKTNGRQISAVITFANHTPLVNEDINSMVISTNGNILKSVMTQIELDTNVEIPEKTNFNVVFGVKTTGEYEYINFYNFIVKTCDFNADTRSYRILAYDYMLDSMIKYDDEPLNITYPITVKNYLNAICTKFNWTLATNTFANDDTEIAKERFENINYTYRDILDDIAEVTGSIICFRQNELNVIYPTDSSFTLDEEYLKDKNVTIKEKVGPINTVVLSRSAESDNIYYPETLPENPIEFKIIDNQIMNDNDRNIFLPDIYDKLNGLEYYTYDFDTFGLGFMEIGDKYSISLQNVLYPTLILNSEFKVMQGGFEEKLYVDITNKNQTDYTVATPDERNTSLIVDKVNGVITSITENYYTKVEINQTVDGLQTQITQNSGDITTLQQTIEGVSLDITKAGNNLVKNTMLWNYDYWLSNSYSKYIESATPPIETDVYWYCTETSGSYEKGIIYDYNNGSWVATELLRSDLNNSAEDLTQIKILESNETNDNFLSKRAWRFNFDGSEVTFDNTEGLFSNIFEISPTQNEITFSFKAKTNITSGGLYIYLYLFDSTQFSMNDMANHINGIYSFQLTESFDYTQLYKKILIPKLSNVVDVYLDSTAPSDITKLWLKEIDGVFYVYKYNNESQEWEINNEGYNCKDQNNTYYRFYQINNNNVAYYETNANMNTVAGQLFFIDARENNYHSYLEAIIGDIKVEYGKLSDWQPARDESYGINFRADGNGLKISKADNNVILDEDELTGYYKSSKMFSINKNEVYSEVARSIINNVNGLITKKLNNGIYIRYIKE